MQGIAGRFIDGLRAAFHPVRSEMMECCVPGCSAPPVLILSATESTVIRACSEHARAWLSSDARQEASNRDPAGSLASLRKWAAAQGHDDYKGRGGGGPSLPIGRRPLGA